MNHQITDKITSQFSESRLEMFKKGEIITHAGEKPKGVMLLCSGTIEQYDVTPEGTHVTVNIFKPSAFFPMSWAINKTPNTYFYEALTNVTLRRIDAERAVLFLQDNPDVLFDLLSRVYRGTDALLRRLVLTASGNASRRLIYALLIEAYRFGSEQAEGVWRIDITQHNLAARSGIARETVSRELGKLQADQLVARAGRGLVLQVTQLEKLLAISE